MIRETTHSRAAAEPRAAGRPALARIARPLAKGAIKGGLMLYDKGREAAADLRTRLGGLVTEARSELRAGRKPPTGESSEPETAPSGSAKP